MEDLLSTTLDELSARLASMKEPSYRAGQIYEWLHRKGAASWDEMRNVPKSLKEKLSSVYFFSSPQIETVQVSKTDGTRKYLLRMHDGEFVESVLMRYQYGLSLCISSQVGCRMGCSFCASTLLGLTRNLTAGEMLGQIYAISRDAGERISHVVVMGTGEPLDNYDHLVRFLHMISDEHGLHISERDLTVSTCGIVPGIRRLAEEKMAINLALSLHAPNDALRQKIMPVAKAYSLKEIFEVLDMYYAATHRRLTFEYSLIRGVNDTEECVRELAHLIGKRNALVNLIPVNPVRETGYRETNRTNVLFFQKKLENYGIHVTIRREMGRDIDGACGQLRKRYVETDKNS